MGFLMLIKSSVVMSASDARPPRVAPTANEGLWVDGPEPYHEEVDGLRNEFLGLYAQSTDFRDERFNPEGAELNRVHEQESSDRYLLFQKCFWIWDAQELKNENYEACAAKLVIRLKQKRNMEAEPVEKQYDWIHRMGHEFAGELEVICRKSLHQKVCAHFNNWSIPMFWPESVQEQTECGYNAARHVAWSK